MNKYPYPVLSQGSSSYAEGIKFEITNRNVMIIRGSAVFEFDVRMNSNYLKTLLETGAAGMIMRIQTGIYSQTYEMDVVEGNFKCELKMENIASNDVIKVVAYVVANEDMTMEHDEEFMDVYGPDYRVHLHRKDVLAVSNEEKLYCDSGSTDFIRFRVSEEQNGRGFAVEYDTNYINVRIGPQLNTAYAIIKNNRREACMIFDSHLVFEVFVHVLIDLVQQYEEYAESPWYQLFEQAFLRTGEYETFEDFMREAKDEELISMPVIYDMAHKMINNQIENSLISLSRFEEG